MHSLTLLYQCFFVSKERSKVGCVTVRKREEKKRKLVVTEQACAFLLPGIGVMLTKGVYNIKR
jgi:hypothetical protein